MGLAKSCFDAGDVCGVQQCGASSAVATIRVTAEIFTQPPSSLVKELGGIFDAVSRVQCWVVGNCLSHRMFGALQFRSISASPRKRERTILSSRYLLPFFSRQGAAITARWGIHDVKQLDRGLSDPIKDTLHGAWIPSAASAGPYSTVIKRPRDCT